MQVSRKFTWLWAAALLVACQSEPEVPVIPDSVVLSRGSQLVDIAEGTLKSTLLSKINAVGFEGAVEFCHVAARPLTDSISTANDAIVRRTSFRYRNVENAPDSTDRVVLKSYEEASEMGNEIGPVVTRVEGGVRFYRPIRVAPLCTNCHGMPGENLTADLHALILDEYPEDRAVGYEEGDFRGAWVVEFAESAFENEHIQ